MIYNIRIPNRSIRINQEQESQATVGSEMWTPEMRRAGVPNKMDRECPLLQF